MDTSASGTQGHKRAASDGSANSQPSQYKDKGKSKKARENTPSDYDSPESISTDSSFLGGAPGMTVPTPHCQHKRVPSPNDARGLGLCECPTNEWKELDPMGVQRCMIGKFCWDDELREVYQDLEEKALPRKLKFNFEFINLESALRCTVVGCPHPSYEDVKKAYTERLRATVGEVVDRDSEGFTITTEKFFKLCWPCFAPICFKCAEPCGDDEVLTSLPRPERLRKQHPYAAFEGVLTIMVIEVIIDALSGERFEVVLCEKLEPPSESNAEIWEILNTQSRQVWELNYKGLAEKYHGKPRGLRKGPGSATSEDSLERAIMEIAKMESLQTGNPTAGPSHS